MAAGALETTEVSEELRDAFAALQARYDSRTDRLQARMASARGVLLRARTTLWETYQDRLAHEFPELTEPFLVQLEALAIRQVPLDPLQPGTTVDVIAAVLADGSAFGEEDAVAAIFAHRAKERDALKAVVDGFNDVLPTKHGADALTALRERFAALVQRDQSIPCRAALDAVQAYQQKANPDEIDTALRTYAAFVQKEYALAEKHATRRTPRN